MDDIIKGRMFLEPISKLGNFERKLALNLLESSESSSTSIKKYEFELLTYNRGGHEVSRAIYRRVLPFNRKKGHSLTWTNEEKGLIGIRWESQSSTGKTYTPEMGDFEVFERAYEKMLEIGF